MSYDIVINTNRFVSIPRGTVPQSLKSSRLLLWCRLLSGLVWRRRCFLPGKLLKHFLRCRLFSLTIPCDVGNEAAEKKDMTTVWGWRGGGFHRPPCSFFTFLIHAEKCDMDIRGATSGYWLFVFLVLLEVQVDCVLGFSRLTFSTRKLRICPSLLQLEHIRQGFHFHIDEQANETKKDCWCNSSRK